MKRALGVGALALSASMLMSGCLVMRELEWSANKPDPGDRVTAGISLTAPPNTPAAVAAKGPVAPEGYAFFQMFAESDAAPRGSVKPVRFANRSGSFDTTSKFGGPTPLERSRELATTLENEDCTPTPFAAAAAEASAKGIVPGTGSVAVAEDELSYDSVRKIIEAQARVKVPEETPRSVQLMLIASGIWFDDGDGVPEPSEESDDSYSCGAPYTSTLVVK